MLPITTKSSNGRASNQQVDDLQQRRNQCSTAAEARRDSRTISVVSVEEKPAPVAAVSTASSSSPTPSPVVRHAERRFNVFPMKI
jgi:hypothetical protein